jgi:hypothetical protein
MELKLSEKKINRPSSAVDAVAALWKFDAFDTVIVPGENDVEKKQYILQENRCIDSCFSSMLHICDDALCGMDNEYPPECLSFHLCWLLCD